MADLTVIGKPPKAPDTGTQPATLEPAPVTSSNPDAFSGAAQNYAGVQFNDRLLPSLWVQAVQNSDNIPSQAHPFDLPFMDEICLQLQNPPPGTPAVFVAHFSPDTLSTILSPGTKVLLVTQDGLKLEGNVIWASNDSLQDAIPSSSLTVETGYPGETKWVADSGQEDLKKEILKKIGLKAGDVINQPRIEFIKKILAEFFADRIAGVSVATTWDKERKLDVKIMIVMPATSLQPEITFEGEVPEAKKKEAQKKISALLKPPYTLERLHELMENFHNSYNDDPDFSLRGILWPTYNDQGVLILPVGLVFIKNSKPVLMIARVGRDGKPVTGPDGKTKIETENEIPVQLALPLNPDNIEKNLEQLQKHYGLEGMIAMPEGVAIGADETHFQVTLIPSPSEDNIHLENTIGPDAPTLKGFFDIDAQEYVTAESLTAGIAKLKEWYADNGYHLAEEPGWKVENGSLILRPVVTHIAGIRFVPLNAEGEPEPVTEKFTALEKKIRQELPPSFKEGNPFDPKLATDTLARLSDHYNVSATLLPIRYTEGDKGEITIGISPKPSWTLGGEASFQTGHLGGGGGVTTSRHNPEDNLGRIETGIGFEANRDAMLFHEEVNYFRPQVTVSGGKLNASIYSQQATGNIFPFVAGGYAEVAHPLPSLDSGWWFLTGAGADYTHSKIQGTGVWARALVGLEYTSPARGAELRLDGMPVVNALDGTTYGKIRLRADKKIPVSEDGSLYFDFHFQGGMIFASPSLPLGQQFNFIDSLRLPTFSSPDPSATGFHYAAVRGALMKHVLDLGPLGPLNLGVGVSTLLQPGSSVPQVGGGLVLEAGNLALTVGPALVFPEPNHKLDVEPSLMVGFRY